MCYSPALGGLKGTRKATHGGLCCRHPLGEEGHATWRSLGRQGPPRTSLGDSSWQCPLCYPQLSRRPPRSTAGGFAPGRCIPEPPWAAPQRGSRHGAPHGPTSTAECGEPAPHRGTPSAPPSPAGPPSPASSWGNTGMSITLGVKRWGGKNTQELPHAYTKLIFLPFSPSQQPTPTHTQQVLSP